MKSMDTLIKEHNVFYVMHFSSGNVFGAYNLPGKQ